MKEKGTGLSYFFTLADQIILLNHGSIEEIGTHTELMKKQGHYYEMVQEQEKAKAWIVEGE